ncbi:hypothetical protein [Shewanella marina]|uniref:hypothetical protein n=1 Tax=Shewanella marina TaxID=487319 RepID=UPI000A7F8E95|nr:hypothetical protein [Shewanella marina]
MNTDPILAALEQSTQASIDQTRVAQALAEEVAGRFKVLTNALQSKNKMLNKQYRI